MVFFGSTLWESSLAEQANDTFRAERERLRVSFLQFRSRSESLASQIHVDLPHLTVHDLTHSDALWEIASTIAGREYPLNPLEAYVLGGAFLVHDLGQTLAAYPRGVDDVKKDPAWNDTVVKVRASTIHESDAEIEKQAVEQILRLRHADRAQCLTTIPFRHLNFDTEYFLIDDVDLRLSLGPLIGKIARSHWLTLTEVESTFAAQVGPPAQFPAKWVIDTLKIACLLRVADACHLDARRAPGFLRALRKPDGQALEHWRFQERLSKPHVERNELVFTSARDFLPTEADAWWLLHDALNVAHHELQDANSALHSANRTKFDVYGVAGAGSPARLTKYVPTQLWKPVDTRIRVSDVGALVLKLGGKYLYGDNPKVPLRELIQNAADAVRARRIAEDRPDNWGEITVCLGADESGDWIDVSDTGIGMSDQVLAGPLLDFGASYWGSDLMLREHPGLLSKGFDAEGQYGIGFFSVFMWGNRVRVTTRRPTDAAADTRILTFDAGTSSRPILRRANIGEEMKEGGTSVRVWLIEPAERTLLAPDQSGHPAPWTRRTQIWMLEELCLWLCPALDVNLSVSFRDHAASTMLRASDWKTLSGGDLLNRLMVHKTPKDIDWPLPLMVLLGNIVRPLYDAQGNLAGRACVFPPLFDGMQIEFPGVVTAGPFRAIHVPGIIGVILGRSTKVSREEVASVASREEVIRWASEQADIIPQISQDPSVLMQCAMIIRQLVGDTGDLPIAKRGSEWVSYHDIACDGNLPDEVIVMRNDPYIQHRQQATRVISYSSNVFQTTRMWKAESWQSLVGKTLEPKWLNATLQGATVEAIAKAWGVSVEDALSQASISKTGLTGQPVEENFTAIVGIDDEGKPVEVTGIDILRKPSSPTVIGKS